MLPQPLRILWGDLTGEEMKRFGVLSTAFFFIIGSYWLLKTVKDAIFNDLVGLDYQPKAKLASVFIIIPLVLLYSKLVDLVEKHLLFYIICSLYAGMFATVAYLIANPISEIHSPLIDWIPGRFLGWFSYLAIESFGSIAVALFWSFVASTTSTQSAKRGYAMIIISAQIGAIAGPTLVTYAPVLGLPRLIYYAALGIFTVPFIIRFFVKNYQPTPDTQLSTANTPEPTGLFEGLHLLLTRSYLVGVFVIATVYEIVGTIMDYQMKVLAKAQFPAREQLAAFMGKFGQASNILALAFAIIGTSYFLRRFGVQICLIMFPASIGLVLCYVAFNPSLWPVFVAMIIIKGLNYSLNNPVKEMMYIPTSKDVKFKAKGWIDMFGSRYSKAMGSIINDYAKVNIMLYGTMLSVGVVGVWVVAAILVGKHYNNLIRRNEIIS